MSATTAGVIVVAFLALVAIIGLFLFRQRAKLKLKGPGNTTLDFDATNTPQPAIRGRDWKSGKGAVTAIDGTGRGADIDKIAADKDIHVEARPNGPKA